MQRQALLLAAATALVAITLAWLARERIWRRPPLAAVAVALVVGLLFLLRRIGWGELLVVAVVLLVPMLLVPARK
jgi:hypothetical protein